jgi:hypothetical protein
MITPLHQNKLTPVKLKIMELLGNSCANCGYNTSLLPLSIRYTATGKARPPSYPYPLWMSEALMACLSGLDTFMLRCENCSVVALAGRKALPPDEIARIAFWSGAKSPEEALGWRIGWMDLREQESFPCFIQPSNGMIYPYSPGEVWSSISPVAPDWESFAAKKGLRPQPPPPGTTILELREIPK